MKETFYFLVIILLLALLSRGTQEKITDSETRIIEAIEKNDSINAVKFLNREK
jgi:hypothetical protein